MIPSKLAAVAALMMVLTACGDPLVGEAPFANYAPTIGAVGTLVTEEDTPLVGVQLAVGDPDGVETVSLVLRSSDQAVIPDAGLSATGTGPERLLTIVPAPDAFGEAVITAVATDGFFEATTTFLVRVTPVNDLPVVSAIGEQHVDEDGVLGPIAFSVTDVDDALDTLVIAVASSDTNVIPDAGVVLSGGAGEYGLIITPAPDASGEVTITITANDGKGDGVVTFTVVVAPVNDAPTIEAIAMITMEEDVPSAPIAITISDVDSPLDALVVTSVSDNPALFDPASAYVFGGSAGARTLTLYSALDASGNATITVTVSDGALDASVSFPVTVTPVDDAPTLVVSASTLVTDEDTTSEAITITVADVDSPLDDITLSASADDAGLVPPGAAVFGGTGATRELVIEPGADQNGVTTLSIVATSGGLPSASASVELTVHSINDAPLITTPIVVPIAIAEGTDTGWQSFFAEEKPGADDEDAPTDLRTYYEATDGVTCDVQQIGGRAIRCTPPSDFIGDFTVTYRVRDTGGLYSDPATFMVTVTPGQNAPVIEGLPETLGRNEDFPTTTSLPFTVTDDDVNDMWNVDVDWEVLGSELTAVVTGTYPSYSLTLTSVPEQHGTVHVRITATDTTGLTDEHLLTVTIYPLNDAPTPVDDTFETSGNRHLSVDAPGVLANDTDIDGDAVVAVAVTDAATAEGGTISIAADGSFVYLPPPGFLGTDTYEYTVRDDAATPREGTATISITVGAPVIWFVDGAAPAGGDGTDLAPFDSLDDLVDAEDDPDDLIEVACGSTYAGQSIVLKDGQILYGYDEGTPDCRPILEDATGDVITLAQRNSVSNFSISGAAGYAITGAGIGGATVIENVDVDGGAGGFQLTGPGSGSLSIAGVAIDVDSGSGLSLSMVGTLTVTDTSVATADGAALDVHGAVVSADGVAFSTVTSTGSTVGGVALSNITGAVSIDALELNTTGGLGLYVDSVTELAIAAGTVASGDASAVSIAEAALAVSLTSVDCNGDVDGDGLDVAPVGIELEATTGSFVVSGAGVGAGSGGVLENLALGVSLVDTQGVSLSYMSIEEGAGGAVVGDGTNALAVLHGTIIGDETDDTASAAMSGAIDLTAPTGATTIDDVECAWPAAYCVYVHASGAAGASDSIAISDSLFGSDTLPASADRGGVYVLANSAVSGSALPVSSTGNRFDGLGRGGLSVRLENTANVDLVVDADTFGRGGHLVDVDAGDTSTLTFDIANATGGALIGVADAIRVRAGRSNGDVVVASGTIADNTLGWLGTGQNPDVPAGDHGVVVDFQGNGEATVGIWRNDITRAWEQAIYLSAQADAPADSEGLHAELHDNVLTSVAGEANIFALGFRTTNAEMCTDVAGNDLRNADNRDISFDQSSDALFIIEGLVEASGDAVLNAADLQNLLEFANGAYDNLGLGTARIDSTAQVLRTTEDCRSVGP